MSDAEIKRAFVCPGQGSQTIGMGKELFDNIPAARAVFEEIDDALSQKLSTLMFEGDQDELTLTHNAQPALMAVSIAVVKTLEKEFDVKLPDVASYVAGHSLGEYSALTAVGAISLSDTAKLLKLRGEAMQRAVPVGEGAMAAIIGMSFENVVAVAEECSTDGVCVAANDNADGQTVISGSKSAVERAMVLAKEKGAKMCVALPVSAPFHCSLMQSAADEMEAALKNTNIIAPSIPLIANVTAKAETDPEVIRKLLVEQVTGRVRWRESVLEMGQLGVTSMVEVGAGKVLTGLVRRIDRNIKGQSLQTPAHIEAFVTSLNS